MRYKWTSCNMVVLSNNFGKIASVKHLPKQFLFHFDVISYLLGKFPSLSTSPAAPLYISSYWVVMINQISRLTVLYQLFYVSASLVKHMYDPYCILVVCRFACFLLKRNFG